MGREGAFDGLFKLNNERSDRSFLIANPVSSSPSGMFVKPHTLLNQPLLDC